MVGCDKEMLSGILRVSSKGVNGVFEIRMDNNSFEDYGKDIEILSQVGGWNIQNNREKFLGHYT